MAHPRKVSIQKCGGGLGGGQSPATRYLEIAFEIVAEQSERKVTEKAEAGSATPSPRLAPAAWHTAWTTGRSCTRRRRSTCPRQAAREHERESPAVAHTPGRE